MHKIKTILIIVFILLPLITSAQIDFFNDLLNLDASQENTDTEQEIFLEDLKLVWSADTYTPYEYEGRALPVVSSEVTVNAIINVSGGDPRRLKYSWFLDDVFQESKSGYGRDDFKFRIRNTRSNSQIVSLQIFNESRSFFIEKSLTIPVVEPEVIICPSRLSDQEKQISTVKAGKTSSFVAKPYFFSIEKLTDLTFEWRFANNARLSAVSSTYGANILDLLVSEKTDNQVSEQNLLLDVKNKTNSFQDASKMIKVQIY